MAVESQACRAIGSCDRTRSHETTNVWHSLDCHRKEKDVVVQGAREVLQALMSCSRLLQVGDGSSEASCNGSGSWWQLVSKPAGRLASLLLMMDRSTRIVSSQKAHPKLHQLDSYVCALRKCSAGCCIMQGELLLSRPGQHTGRLGSTVNAGWQGLRADRIRSAHCCEPDCHSDGRQPAGAPTPAASFSRH